MSDNKQTRPKPSLVDIPEPAGQPPVRADRVLTRRRPEVEAPFDAVVGLSLTIDAELNDRSEGVAQDDVIRSVEGWVFGQKTRSVSGPPSSRHIAESG